MNDHPSSRDLMRFARGTLAPARSRKRVLAHLLRGCRSCSQVLARSMNLELEGTVTELAGQVGGLELAARAPASALPAPSESATKEALPRNQTLPAYDRVVDRACAKVMRHHHELLRERAEIARLIAATAGGRSSAQATGQVPPTKCRRLSESLPMVEALLEISRSLNYTDPSEMRNLAELALFAAERLDAKRYSKEVVADVRARSWAELANAHRVLDDLAAAELAMRRAVTWQRRGSGEPLLLACIADVMASLLASQRRFREAIELLAKMYVFYLRRGENHLAGRALIKQAMFTSDDNDIREGLCLLAEGVDLIDLDREPKLGLMAFHSLITNLVESGRFRQARIYLWRAQALYQHYADPLLMLRFHWLQARIAVGLGDSQRAEEGFAAARKGFAKARQPYSAALVGLDLAAMWVTLGKTAQVRTLVEEMITTFRALRIAREAVAALLILREACDREEATVEGVRAVTLLLTELERQPSRRRDGRDEGPNSPRPARS